MQISKDSWHFKLNKVMNTKFESNVIAEKVYTTCSYIRATAFSIMKSVFMLFVALFMAGFMLTMLSGMIVMPMAVAMGIKDVPEPIVILGFVGWAFLILIALGHIGSAIGRWSDRRAEAREEKASLLNQALKDRKDGICTIVTFK